MKEYKENGTYFIVRDVSELPQGCMNSCQPEVSLVCEKLGWMCAGVNFDNCGLSGS